MLSVCVAGAGALFALPAAADDWAAPIVGVQKSLADSGVSIGGGVTGFAQGMAFGDGIYGIPVGGKADLTVGLDGDKLGLWSGFSVFAHFEQDFGQNANFQGDGSIIPLNTALAFPTLGGTTTDLSLIVTQAFGSNFSISLGKFNMLDAAAKTPILGGGGETTFWNTGLAAPISGVTPPYIIGGLLTVKTQPVIFSLLIYDPRNAQKLTVIQHPFADGATFSLSATVPWTIAGLTGYQTLRGVYSSQKGFDLEDIPQLILPPGSGAGLTSKRGYYFGSYAFDQFLWQDPDHPGRSYAGF
jgi:porin